MAPWDEDENGVIIQVVVRHEAALLGPSGPVLRVEYASRQDPIGGPSRSIQLGMTVKQALAIAQDLFELANTAKPL